MKTWQENQVTKIDSPRVLYWVLSFLKEVKHSMTQLVNSDREKSDDIQNALKEVTTECSEYYSRANFIGFKWPSVKDTRYVPFNFLSCVNAAYKQCKIWIFLNIKPSGQFMVYITTNDLFKVDKKPHDMIMDILERDHVITDQKTQKSSTTTI